MVWGAVRQFGEQEIRLADINILNLVIAMGLYLLTMSLSWIFWHIVLRKFGQQPQALRSARAFFISQLGKYVPGKAMVIILRTDLVQGEKVNVGPAAASVFVETLTWIFVGSVIGSVFLIVQYSDFLLLVVAAIGIMLVSGVLTWPPVFQRIVSRIRPNDPVDFNIGFKNLLQGWLLLSLGWVLNAMTLWFVVGAMPGCEVTADHLPLMLTTVTIATVGGFVSLIPGGLGVRELVMIPLLGAEFGSVVAVVAAIVIRLVWLAAELVASAIMELAWRTMPNAFGRN